MYELAATSSVAIPLAVTNVKAINLQEERVANCQLCLCPSCKILLVRTPSRCLHSVFFIFCCGPEQHSADGKQCQTDVNSQFVAIFSHE